MSNPKWVVGIDYSMSCPAITIIATDQEFNFENCRVYYLSEKLPKALLPNVMGTRLGAYDHNEERFDMIASWAIDKIPSDSTVYIEDYSFGSKGKVFHIAENAGLIKHKIWKQGVPINVVPPTVVKKFAFGKGNATKEQMHEAFLKETGVDLIPIYQPKATKVGSPVGDIVDSFFLCKYGYYSVPSR